MRPAVAGQRCIREASMGNEVGGPRPHIAGSCPSPALRIPAVPFKANADRRHHIPKQRHRVTNWAEYDAALRQRGSLTVWFTDDARRATVLLCPGDHDGTDTARRLSPGAAPDRGADRVDHSLARSRSIG